MFRKTENGLWKVSFSPAVHTEKKQIHKQLFQLMHLIIYLKMNIVVIHIHISCNMSIGVAKYAHMHEQNVVILLIITSAFNIKFLCLYLQTNKKTQNDHGNKSGYWKLQPESCINCHCKYWHCTETKHLAFLLHSPSNCCPFFWSRWFTVLQIFVLNSLIWPKVMHTVKEQTTFRCNTIK